MDGDYQVQEDTVMLSFSVYKVDLRWTKAEFVFTIYEADGWGWVFERFLPFG